MNPRTQLVIDELARHRRQFEHLCLSLSYGEQRAVIPGSHWTVKDYVAHLATIDALIAGAFSRGRGFEVEPPDVPVTAPFDIDDWNEAAVRHRESASMAELLERAAIHRADMVRCIEQMTDEDLDRIIPYGGDRKSLGLAPTNVRFGGLLWGIAIHDTTHTRDILRALPERREEAWLNEWLSSVNDSLIPQGVREQRV